MVRKRGPLRWVMAIWFLFSVLTTTLATLQGRNLSQRLARLSSQLPGERSPSNCSDELAVIEQQLAPLMTQPSGAQTIATTDLSDSVAEIATVAIHCKNLDRLEALLTQENMQRIYIQLDHSLNQVAKLYAGQRLDSHHQTLFIEFKGDSPEDDHPLRALFCATIILQLIDHQTKSLGISIELSAAVTLFNSTNPAPLKSEFEQEKRQSKAIKMAKLGAAGELLTDPDTFQHTSVGDKINCNEFSGKPDILSVTGFSKIYSSLLDKQFSYMTQDNNNAPPATDQDKDNTPAPV